MKIIKRNGSEAVFDISKIMMAVSRANEVVQANQKLKQSPDQCDSRTGGRGCAALGRMR